MDEIQAIGPQPLAGGPVRQTQDAERERASLEKAAHEFEALFVGTLLKSMRSTVPESGLIDDKGEIKYYRQLYDEELANSVTSTRGGLGIADLIINQFDQTHGTLDRDPEIGPPSPVAVQRDYAVARYLDSAPATTRGDILGDAMQSLRGRAAELGGSVADSLGRYEKEITAAAADSGVSPALILSVMMKESNGDRQAVSRAGAMGLMQLMPGTAADLGVTDPLDPEQNLSGGAGYLAGMLDRFGSDLDLALAAYNAGPGNVEKAGNRIPPWRETEDYVQRVSELYEELGGVRGTEMASYGK